MKEGWRTTEFWVAMIVLGIVGALLVVRVVKTGSLAGTWELLAAALTAVGYGLSRALTKRSASPPGASSSEPS